MAGKPRRVPGAWQAAADNAKYCRHGIPVSVVNDRGGFETRPCIAHRRAGYVPQYSALLHAGLQTRKSFGDGGMSARELFDLRGRVALVTGASSGLGVRFAHVLAAEGASVVLVARRAERLAAVQTAIETAGGRAVAVAADVLDRAAMTRAFERAEHAFGCVNILVNNAGVAHGSRAVELSEEEWRRVIGTNLDAVFFWAQEAARRMLAAGEPGAIINIASVLGIGVAKGTAAYAVAKSGVIQLTKALGLELAFKGIRVNAIAPGWFVTDLNRDYLTSAEGAALKREIPAGRFGEEGDLDGAILLLASDAGRYMAGTTIVVDGGQILALRG
jgi:3-oxoacyl-[acyl-carrier protein] reductase